jgi:N-acetyl sugar amidotransferase
MKACKRCLFNASNYPEMILDQEGICDICLVNDMRINKALDKRKKFSEQQIIQLLKTNKKGKYDCLIGISGGTDSSYMVYLAKKWGLNPLLLHVDGGWNTETSVINIEKIVTKSGFDFVTEVLPWNEMRDVQQAFIKANVIDIDLPFDNAMLKYNYLTAEKYKIKFILNGYSTLTEGVMPSSFTHYKLDKRNILAIHQKFGETPLKQLKFIGTSGHFVYDRVKKIRFLYPLDLFDYNKSQAKRVIAEEFDWKDYGGKHYENVFTRFYQGKILPIKFNIDKRVSHLSMLICVNQLSQKEAFDELTSTPPYPNPLLERDDELFFRKKLRLEKNFFDLYLKSTPISHRVYKSDLDYYDTFKPYYRILKRMIGLNFFR